MNEVWYDTTSPQQGSQERSLMMPTIKMVIFFAMQVWAMEGRTEQPLKGCGGDRPPPKEASSLWYPSCASVGWWPYRPPVKTFTCIKRHKDTNSSTEIQPHRSLSSSCTCLLLLTFPSGTAILVPLRAHGGSVEDDVAAWPLPICVEHRLALERDRYTSRGWKYPPGISNPLPFERQTKSNRFSLILFALLGTLIRSSYVPDGFGGHPASRSRYRMNWSDGAVTDWLLDWRSRWTLPFNVDDGGRHIWGSRIGAFPWRNIGNRVCPTNRSSSS